MKSSIFATAALVASVAAAPSYGQAAPAAAAAIAPAGQYNNVATPAPAAAEARQYTNGAAAPVSTPCLTAAAAAAAPTPAAGAYGKQPEVQVVPADKYDAPAAAAAAPAPAVPEAAYGAPTPAYNGVAPASTSTPCDKSKTAAAALDADYAAPTAAATTPCEKATAAAVPTAVYEQPAPAYGEAKPKEAKNVEGSLYQTDKSSAGKVGASFVVVAAVGAGLLL
ncbi:hypothetical protein BCR44DRAFT_34037 [Catenaria anguillulae PL171]|uniref:Uncharacterized protein n=1 Tax=Catenaria anguillulae PL171 TaxID=765915 RepID=A0A1Y2HWA7_9FUNG|nr:hypothetical protein BCR44DRAFT_34037 [Catenaria anguillulae PL171]